jgi:aerobic carbon-monoxide dehydrogenase medium subunit
MKPAPFEYHRPDTVEAAVALLAEFGDGAKVLAGGQSLVPMLALRLAAFDHLIDIGRIGALCGIDHVDSRVSIGAGTTQATIERSSVMAEYVPLLARATPFIGHFQIRNRGTIGGSLAHADPAAEYPAVALALDAEFGIVGASGRRSVAASDFFTGLWSTALDDGDLLTDITFPVWSGRCGFAVREFARRHGDYAVAGAAVAVELDVADAVVRCAVALFGLGATPVRALDVERDLVGAPAVAMAPTEVGRRAVAMATSIPSDLHGSADYRRRVGTVVVADAWTAALEEARRE